MTYGARGRVAILGSGTSQTTFRTLKQEIFCVPCASTGIFGELIGGARFGLTICFYWSGRQDLNLRLLRPEGTDQSPIFETVPFKDATGLSPHRYVTLRRVELAKVLLISTRLSIAQVARSVGIHNQSHFAAHFRRLVGCSPAEFRNRP